MRDKGRLPAEDNLSSSAPLASSNISICQSYVQERYGTLQIDKAKTCDCQFLFVGEKSINISKQETLLTKITKIKYGKWNLTNNHLHCTLLSDPRNPPSESFIA